MSAFPKSCHFTILFPFQATDPPRQRPREEEDDEDAMSWSLTEEEECYNLVSPLLTSKFTISVLNVAWHSFPNPSFPGPPRM